MLGFERGMDRIGLNPFLATAFGFFGFGYTLFLHAACFLLQAVVSEAGTHT
jgi:hypothetical protein